VIRAGRQSALLTRPDAESFQRGVRSEGVTSQSRSHVSHPSEPVPRETNGGLLIIEHQNLKGGPPVHAHPRQEEWFFVMEGEVLFQVGERRVTLHAGESILGPRGGPRGVPHAFSAIGAQPAHILITFTPEAFSFLSASLSANRSQLNARRTNQTRNRQLEPQRGNRSVRKATARPSPEVDDRCTDESGTVLRSRSVRARR
jgi:mannose-6-phosphate isomerase-like protein (cupin superfamily)